MTCKDLAADNCPCVLALLAQCKYCSLLNGQDTCSCDWQHRCAYEQLRWRNIEVDNYADNSIMAILTTATTIGIVIKTDAAFSCADEGTVLAISCDSRLVPKPITAVLRKAVKEHRLIYVETDDLCPACIQGHSLELHMLDA